MGSCESRAWMPKDPPLENMAAHMSWCKNPECYKEFAPRLKEAGLMADRRYVYEVTCNLCGEILITEWDQKAANLVMWDHFGVSHWAERENIGNPCGGSYKRIERPTGALLADLDRVLKVTEA